MEKETNKTVRVRFLHASGFLAFTDTMLESTKQSHTSEDVQMCKSGRIHVFPCG